MFPTRCRGSEHSRWRLFLGDADAPGWQERIDVALRKAAGEVSSAAARSARRHLGPEHGGGFRRLEIVEEGSGDIGVLALRRAPVRPEVLLQASGARIGALLASFGSISLFGHSLHLFGPL